MSYDDFFEIINKEKDNNHLSHAFLIETNDINDISSFINKFIKILLYKDDSNYNIKIDELVDNNSYPDLKYIEPNGAFIKKEQIIDVISDFSNSSYYDNKQIYVINDASKLNGSSGNTLLKFLEEPHDGVIAILLCKNRYSVLNTLVSRCQVYSVNGSSLFNLSDDEILIFQSLFSKNKGFLAYNSIIKDLPDKISFINFLNKCEKYIFSIINHSNNNSLINKDNSFKYILLIEKYLSNSLYNVNYKLFLDNFLVDIEEVI